MKQHGDMVAATRQRPTTHWVLVRLLFPVTSDLCEHLAGVRDRMLLDKKDSRHVSSHFDAKKTTSKKKSRVGAAGKQARDKKKLVKAKTSV